jgi:hypothetical protein
MAKQCPNCQQLLDEAVRFCPICGARVNEIKPLDAPIEIADSQLPPPLIPETPSSSVNFPQDSAGLPPLPSVEPNLIKPALLAGMALAVLSALPIVSCCCLIWLIGAGILAVYLLRNEYPGEITPGLGMRLGLLTALLGSLFWQVLDLPLSLIDSRMEGLRRLEEFVRNNQNLPAESLQVFERLFSLFSNPLNPFVILIGVLGKLILCGVLTTLGGLLGVAFFGKPKPADFGKR